MYVCMYVCMYVRMYVCMYVRTYICMYVCMYVCMSYVYSAFLSHAAYCMCVLYVDAVLVATPYYGMFAADCGRMAEAKLIHVDTYSSVRA